MRKLQIFGLVILAFMALQFTIPGEQKTLEADKKESYIEFRVPYFEAYNLLGRFKSFSVSLQHEKEDLTDAQVKVVIKVRSVILPEAKLEKEFVKEYLLDATHYPEAIFESTHIERVGEDKLIIDGRLTIRGEEKFVRFNGKDKGLRYDAKSSGRELELIGKVNRFDFGIADKTQMHGGLGYVVGDSVEIRGSFLLR